MCRTALAVGQFGGKDASGAGADEHADTRSAIAFAQLLCSGDEIILLQGQPLQGTLAISSALKYDPVRRAVLLDHPSVERVDVNGMPPAYCQQLTAIGGTVAQQVLDQYPIYTFRPEQLRYGGRDVEPGAITVLPDGIKVEVKTQ